MMNDPAVPATWCDALDSSFSGCGSPARMAALLLLGQNPAGVRSDALRLAIRTADARVWDEGRMQNVLTAIRTAGLAAVERDEFGRPRWYSPGARQVARLRGTWPAPASRTATPTTTPTAAPHNTHTTTGAPA